MKQMVQIVKTSRSCTAELNKTIRGSEDRCWSRSSITMRTTWQISTTPMIQSASINCSLLTVGRWSHTEQRCLSISVLSDQTRSVWTWGDKSPTVRHVVEAPINRWYELKIDAATQHVVETYITQRNGRRCTEGVGWMKDWQDCVRLGLDERSTWVILFDSPACCHRFTFCLYSVIRKVICNKTNGQTN